MGKVTKVSRDEKPPLRKPVTEHAVSNNGVRTQKQQNRKEINFIKRIEGYSKKIVCNTSSYKIRMANKVRAKYQHIAAVADCNIKNRRLSSAASVAIENSRTQIATDSRVHDTDLDDLCAMFSKLNISGDLDHGYTDTIHVDSLPSYESRQSIDINAQEQIKNALQQIRFKIAVSQQLSRSLGNTSLTGTSRQRKRSACDKDDGDDSGCDVLSDEEYLVKRRKFSNKERNFA